MLLNPDECRRISGRDCRHFGRFYVQSMLKKSIKVAVDHCRQLCSRSKDLSGKRRAEYSYAEIPRPSLATNHLRNLAVLAQEEAEKTTGRTSIVRRRRSAIKNITISLLALALFFSVVEKGGCYDFRYNIRTTKGSSPHR